VEREHLGFPGTDRLGEPAALTHASRVPVCVEPGEAPSRG
jgi:hypothetical protein